MVTLSLKISLEGGKVVKTIQFEPTTTVYDACRVIREKILEANANDPKEYGLFLASEEDNKKGIWLEASRSLDYYMLRNGDLLEYNKKTRNLRVRMLDGTVKTLLVDDSQIVANLMVVICTKIGITNYDEYGLVREEQKEEADPCEKPNYGTLTLKRRHHEKERDAKMEQLRKKLRTDDEVNWVEPSKTLREQGIETSETLLLRRRLFFSDRNVDSRDPVQLTLLYVQARDAILAGTHPITQDKACEFAGIQCQIQFGDHKEDKHTTGFLDLKEFLPASYMKVKGIEKKVFREHRKHAGLSELDAKVLYTKSARDLKTYGVAFFLVKEKMKGKNKLVPRLLGVTKDSVLRLDEKTKEILQTWPLTTVRRWCASQNTFTLDFGDYSDQYYSVQTTEAEQILQVISGYIDIIVRRRRAAARLGLDGDEGSAMLEDTVHPSKANIIQHDTFKSGKVNQESVAKPAVLRPGAEGAKPFSVGVAGGALQTTLSGRAATGHAPPATTQVQQTKVTSILTEPQRALLSTITSGKEIIKQTEAGLTRTILEHPGSDATSIQWRESRLGSSKQLVTSHIAAMSAATAQVVTLTAGPTEEVDHTAVGAAITTITTNLPEMTKGVQMIAALMEDENSGDNLLDATRKLCSAFSDLLKATEPDAKEPRQSLLNAASRVGEASTGVLHTMGEETEQDKETQDILLSLAKAVANTTAALVLKAKNVAAQCKDEQPLQNTIIAAATHCALATSQLVACAKVVAPSLHSPACRSQLSAAARQVAQAVERLVGAGEGAPAAAAPALDQLMAAARRVTDELERLLAHCDLDRRAQPTVMEQSVESVMCASESVTEAADAPEMVRRARLLGQATARLIADIKTEAENQPSDSQCKLLAAAKLLADATARMVEAARQCASLPQDREKQEALRRAAEELKLIAVDYAEHQGAPGRQQARLAESARQAASSATQLITSAHNATHYNTNKYSQESLLSECVSLGERSSRLAQAARLYSAAPADPAAGLALLSAADTFLQPSGHVIQAARGVLPNVSDAAAAKQLADTAHMFTASCADLRSSTSRARSSGRGGELNAAEHVLLSLQEELDELEAAIGEFAPKPQPGHTREWACGRLQTAGRSAASAGAQLAAGARRGDGAVAARAGSELAAALQDFTPPLRAALAVASEPQQRKVLSYGRRVVSSSLTLVRRVRSQLAGAQPDHDDLMALARDVSENIEQTIEAVPSHAELDAALDSIAQTLGVLDMGEFPASDRPYGELQTELTSAAVELNSASARVAEGAVADSLPPAAENFLTSFDRLVAVGLEMAGRTEEAESRIEMVGSLKTVTVNSTKLLTTAKSVSQEPTRPNARNELAAAARAVTDAINGLVDACTEAAPGQKECAAAARSIASARTLLAAPAQPLSDLGYFACLDAVVDHSKTLSEGMSGMAGAVKVGAGGTERLCHSVRTVAGAVQGLVECAAQAAYLVAVSDESSVAGRAGLVDQAQFARAAAAIDTACGALADPRVQQHQVLSAATAIAKYTSALCTACRAASARCNEPQSKRHFVQAAKDVANSTSSLVKEIKALDADYCEANLSRCAAATRPVQDAVRSLRHFADSPEFAAVPARISAQARDNQEAILQCGRSIISESCAMVEAARALALNSTERTHWHTLAHHSKAVSDTIKSLVTNIREKAPGQRECEAALSLVALQQRALERAALHAAGLELQPQPGNTLQGYSEQIENSLAEILERVEPLLLAARSEAEHLGHAVAQLVSYAEPLVSATVGAASHMTESTAQSSLLQHAITVLETLSLLVQAAKHSAGNPRALSAHGEAQAQAVLARSALAELSARVRDLSLQAGAVRPLLESVARAVARLTEHRMSLIGSYDEADSFVDYQTRMVGVAKEIAHLASDMTAKAATEPSRLVEVGNTMVGKYERLAADSVGAAASTPIVDIANRIRVSAVELGECVSELVRAGGHCRLAATALNQRAVADHARRVGEKVVSILGALQAGSRGTQACIDAAATIATILGDLDTTILFASAGTLQSDTPGDTFSNHRENILKTAKTLVEDTKTLVSGAAGSQDQLAAAAQSAVATIVQLCSVVKAGATSLGAGGPEPQVLVLHAARDAAAALRDLAAATAAASGKHVAGQDMQRLKHAAKVMVTNVTSLLKTVKAVEDEHTRGTRALESTIEAISQELEVLWSPPGGTSSVEELVRCARLMTAATSRAVAASGQDQLTAAANLGRRTVLDVLAAARGAAHAADTEEARRRTLESAQAVAESYRALLGALLAPARAQLPDLSRRVAQAVADVLSAAELLKGSEWVDPADPTVIAEQELLGAAASIDAAARKLDALRPRTQTTKQETDENLNFDEMILEAAKSIIAATSALVRAAGAAQRELTDRDGGTRRPPTAGADDGQWSEGLVSAARLVAAATHALVEAANALVQGAATEERLISSARQVASSTAQLLVACQVKADPGSDSSRRLRAAGAGVIRSTDNLVRAARDAIAGDDERSLVLNRRMVGGIAQEIDARSEVLRIEKELEEARGRLTAIRQAKYKLRDTSGDDTDTDQPGDTSDTSGPGNRFKTPGSSFNTTYTPNSTFTQNTTHNTTHNSTLNTTHNTTLNTTQNSTQNISLNQSYSQNGLSQDKSPSFSSFRPQDETPKNYEGFTTRTRSMSEEPVVVRSLRLPEVRTAFLVEESTRVYYKRAPPPPPRRTHNYETRLYDTPRPVDDYYSKTDERRHYETNQSYKEQKFGYETPKAAPMSPKFNARDMKFDEKQEPIYSTLKKPAAFEGLGQNYSEHHKSTEKIPGGTKHSEYTVKSESYQSHPRTEFFKTETRQEVKSPFATSTPSKFNRPDIPEFPKPTLEIVKAPTPDYDRISSPYGKDVHSYGGPNFFEETTTEVKEIPNGTQKITTTKIYSSSPVNMTTTNTKYEPVKLEGLDELSKSFDNDSKYSTLDSRFNTLESKLSSDTSRSFMRPSEFQSSDFQATSSVSKTKPSDLLKEIDSMDRKFSKQTISSEIIEKKSVMTSSHKSETSSTVTKKFGNF